MKKTLTEITEELSQNFYEGQIVWKPGDKDLLVGKVAHKMVADGGYRFCYVKWNEYSFLSPEHYQALRPIKSPDIPVWKSLSDTGNI